ncbi:MAG TPA: response regulator, partial [Thermoanaerobaculia bacterium]|nr:response regulator [Thermoanaerobaculia bacterium]
MPKTILLADDSVTIQKVIELTFMDEDYEVVSVGNGDEALDRLEEVTPDVVIADVHMPGASGYDVARRARQLHPQAPVLLLVGTFEPFDEADFEASGAKGYLKKPFDSQELLTRVARLMADRPAAAEAAPASPPAAPSVGAAPPWEEEAAVPSASTEELPPPGPSAAAGAWATESFTPADEADETVDRAAWDDEKTDPFRLAREEATAGEAEPIAAEAQREADTPDPTATRAISAVREPELDVSGWQGSAWDLEAAESGTAGSGAAGSVAAGDSVQERAGEGADEQRSPWTGGWELEEEPPPTQVRPPEETVLAGSGLGSAREATPPAAAPTAPAAATARPAVAEPEPFPELAAPPAASALPAPSAAPVAAETASPGVAAPAAAAAGDPEGRLSDEDV